MSRTTRFILSAAPALLMLGGCSVPLTPGADEAARNANTRGWTGRTVVVGNNSTVAGDAEATYLAQKWGVGQRR